MPTLTETTRPSDSLLPETLLEMYWQMLLSRRLDERSWLLHRQGKIPFHVSAIGHEATQIGAVFAINRGIDYVCPYYRDLALMLAIGITPRDFVISLFGKEGEYSSRARQMPSHWSNRKLNIISTSSVVATQVPQAAGLAFAIKYRWNNKLVDPTDETQPRLAFTTLGEGSTSQGEWHEGMNWAAVHSLPFICLVQNNNYAISVPLSRQMAVASVAERAKAYGILAQTVDGNDVLQVYVVMKTSTERAYRSEGPTLIEAKCYRLTPHSSDDDDRGYRSRAEVEEAKRSDPIVRFGQHLMGRDILIQDLKDEYEARIRHIINEAQREAENLPYPPVSSIYEGVYAPGELHPRSSFR
jgi:2-oxoisovalerate dehydrogenase E1 component alpha subunit